MVTFFFCTWAPITLVRVAAHACSFAQKSGRSKSTGSLSFACGCIVIRYAHHLVFVPPLRIMHGSDCACPRARLSRVLLFSRLQPAFCDTYVPRHAVYCIHMAVNMPFLRPKLGSPKVVLESEWAGRTAIAEVAKKHRGCSQRNLHGHKTGTTQEQMRET